jgi:hypothetical protein
MTAKWSVRVLATKPARQRIPRLRTFGLLLVLVLISSTRATFDDAASTPDLAQKTAVQLSQFLILAPDFPADGNRTGCDFRL